MIIKCDVCGKGFEPGNNKYGLPTGLGFKLNNDEIFNVCANCLIQKGFELLESEDSAQK